MNAWLVGMRVVLLGAGMFTLLAYGHQAPGAGVALFVGGGLAMVGMLFPRIVELQEVLYWSHQQRVLLRAENAVLRELLRRNGLLDEAERGVADRAPTSEEAQEWREHDPIAHRVLYRDDGERD